MNSNSWMEKRIFHRIPAAAVLEIFLIEKSNGDRSSAQKRRAESLNISAGGILLSTDIALPVGMQVGLLLDLESIHRMNVGWRAEEGHEPAPAIEAIGRVVRVKGAEEIGYEIALAFDEMNGKDAQVLKQFLES
jgi:c-di-GMP-binding flagellar brake protein YcgR